MRTLHLVLLGVLSTLSAVQVWGQNSRVNWYAFSSGFGVATSPATSTKSSMGQVFVGTTQQANTRVTSGFLADTLLRGSVVSVHQQPALPVSHELMQNYPNPFNPTTTIRYQLPKRANVTLRVYNVLGQEVAQLANEEQPPGMYEVQFDAVNFSSGMYFYTMRAGSFVQSKKLMILK